MELKHNITKKGFFFTLLVFIFFFLVLVSIMTWTSTQEPREQTILTNMRVEKLNEFSRLVRDDAARITKIAAFNALKCAARYVATNNTYLNNSNCTAGSCIFELMYNATIGGKTNYTTYITPPPHSELVNFSDSSQMDNLTLSAWDAQILQLANRTGFNASISMDNIAVYQPDPWNVNVGYNLYLNVSDRSLDVVSRSEVIPVLVTVPITNYTYGG